MTTCNRKKLNLPPSMAGLTAEQEKMHLCTANKSQHPGIVDDWEDPDDMETIGEKLKKKVQKKKDQAKTQKERDKEKDSSSARQRVDTSVILENEDLTIQSGDDDFAVLQSRGSAIAEEETSELFAHHPQAELSHMQAAIVSHGDKGSDEESDVYVPPHDPGNITESIEHRDDQEINNGTGTPALVIQNVPMELPMITIPKNLKHKATCAANDSETTNVFESDNDGPKNTTAGTQPEHMQTTQPAKKKKSPRSKATSESKATASSEIMMSGPLRKNWEKKKTEEMCLINKKVLAHHDNDSLVHAGGMVEDHEDIKPEFIDIVKVPAQAVDHKITSSKLNARTAFVMQSTILKISDPVPANITATQVHGGKKKWNMNHLPAGTQQVNCPLPLREIEDVQEAIDVEFGSGEYDITEKGAWMGLANYHITDYHHEICTEAKNVVKEFIIEHSDQLSTAEHIAQYMMWLMTPTVPGKNLEPSPPYMWKVWMKNGTMNDMSMIPFPKGVLLLTAQAVGRAISMWSTSEFMNNVPAFSHQNYNDITEEYALSPAEHAKYGKNARKKSVKTKRMSLYLATLETWGQDKWNTLLIDVKTAIESSTSRKRHKISTSANTTSPNLIEEEPDIVFKSDLLEPESGSGSEGSDSDSDREEEVDEDGSEGADVLINNGAGSGTEEDESADENSIMIIA
ncbi:hypothetical protein F5146DRAFT_1006735 [Armillaria mellea]|nr:hypothetical protein F5146DRAFT_1006735 [Armillaria mellea]